MHNRLAAACHILAVKQETSNMFNTCAKENFDMAATHTHAVRIQYGMSIPGISDPAMIHHQQQAVNASLRCESMSSRQVRLIA
jgi:hypothetical protein